MDMLNRILLVILLFPLYCFSQSEITLDNNLTGIYSQSKNGQQFGINFVGNNSIQKNKISLDLGTNYSFRFNPDISENEFIQRLNIGYNQDRYDIFTTYQYNYSLVRNILADHWIGIGGGVKRSIPYGKTSLSYAFIYENAKYEVFSLEQTFRHSIRFKIKVSGKLFGFSTEYYYQPSTINYSDYIVYGSSKVTVFQNKPFSFIIQDVINYRSISDVKMIHNLTIGCSYKFSKKQ